MDHALVEILHAAEMMIELTHERTRAGKTRRRHLAGEKTDLVCGLRESVRLAIFIELEPVFQMAHELVGRSEPGIFQRRQELFVAQPRKRKQSDAVADPRRA